MNDARDGATLKRARVTRFAIEKSPALDVPDRRWRRTIAGAGIFRYTQKSGSSFSKWERIVIKEYELFAAVVSSGSLSAAGRALGLSPAMVSKRIARLERRLGARLILRTTRRLIMTDVGERFYERVVQILAAAREAEAMGDRPRRSASRSLARVRADIFRSLTHSAVLAGVSRGVSSHCHGTGARRCLHRSDPSTHRCRHSHCALDCSRAKRPTIGAKSPASLRQPGLPRALRCARKPGGLTEHSLLAAESQLPWRLQGRDAAVLVHGRSALVTNSSEVVRELAIAGMGIALRSRWDVARELASGALRVVLPQFPGAADVAIYAVYPSATLVPPGVTAFIDHLAGAYRTIPSLAE